MIRYLHIFKMIFRDHNLTPLARVVGYSDVAGEPVDWPTAPAGGINDLLNRAGKQNQNNLSPYIW